METPRWRSPMRASAHVIVPIDTAIMGAGPPVGVRGFLRSDPSHPCGWSPKPGVPRRRLGLWYDWCSAWAFHTRLGEHRELCDVLAAAADTDVTLRPLRDRYDSDGAVTVGLYELVTLTSVIGRLRDMVVAEQIGGFGLVSEHQVVWVPDTAGLLAEHGGTQLRVTAEGLHLIGPDATMLVAGWDVLSEREIMLRTGEGRRASLRGDPRIVVDNAGGGAGTVTVVAGSNPGTRQWGPLWGTVFEPFEQAVSVAVTGPKTLTITTSH